ALVGQPNVGKSVVFGRLTGRYVTVSNYPGTTVAITKGRALVGAEVCDLIDTPGVNALEGTISEDERITRDVLQSADADVVVQVADARNLRRALMLTGQVAAFAKPMVLVLNMIDEAFARGISIDVAALEAELQIPIVEMVAVEGRGLPELRDALARAARPHVPAHPSASDRAVWAHHLTERVRRVSTLSLAYVQEALARATRRPVTGLPILAVVLYALYLFVGVFGAQTLVKLLEDGVFGGYVNPASVWLADRFIPVPFIRDFLVGQYGLITMGLTYSIAIVLPVVATFFLIFGFLEDSGYIPRLAIFCDRIFRAMGLNGKAVLPMVLGLGCDTMATMTTRILGTPKERLIAILLLALGIPCSAQLATILGILGGISFAALATLFGVVLGQLFLVGTGLLFALDKAGALVWISAAGRPVVTGLLGLPASTSQILVMGFLRRDYGAAGLFQLAHSGQLTGVQAVVALTVMTLFVPCVANFLMMVRERGLKTGLAILGVVTPVAILTAAGLNYVLTALGVRF